MARSDFELDSAGIVAVLNSGEVAAAVEGLAQTVARNVRSRVGDAEVVTDSYRTDRAAASVTIKDPRGKGWEVRHGVLTGAAANVGLEVRAR